MRYLFTSESVTEGHPDKLCDQISDAILDAIYKDDNNARVACETFVTRGLVMVAGEITTNTYVDIPRVVKDIIWEVGYTDLSYGFDSNCGIITSIAEQSPDIDKGVSKSWEVKHRLRDLDQFDERGAGDQGMMFGYACRESKELMPLPIILAHRLAERLAEARKRKIIPYLRPDGKTQVTVEYEDMRPKRIATVLISAQTDEHINVEKKLTPDLKEAVIMPILKRYEKETGVGIGKDLKILINPTGRFETGGPEADTGLTGRKVIVDTYGGMAKHGGGCFSGKDPTKVDRSASYYARYVAKNIVAADLAERCEIQVAYAIGKARPVSLNFNCFGTEKVPLDKIDTCLKSREVFDFRPLAMIENLNLLRPIYRKTACYGHFGRKDKDFTWEKTDKVVLLNSLL